AQHHHREHERAQREQPAREAAVAEGGRGFHAQYGASARAILVAARVVWNRASGRHGRLLRRTEWPGGAMRLEQCCKTADFRRLAQARLPSPIFHYIDGGADDESTMRRNTEAFEAWDPVPNVPAGVDTVDLSTEALGRRLALPLFFAPTAMQRLFHPEGERAIATVAAEFGTLFGVSTIGTRSIEELGPLPAPKLFQIYVHNDPGLTSDLIARCKAAGFDALALTVDTIVGGNRERDIVTGLTTPPKLTPLSFASCPAPPRTPLRYIQCT